MEIEDGFSSAASPGDYVYDQGAMSDVTQVQGRLAPVSAGITVRALHASGHAYGDVRVAITAIPGAVTAGFKAGVILKRISAATYLEAYLTDTSGGSFLLDKVVNGVRTNIGSAAYSWGVSTGSPARLSVTLTGREVRFDSAPRDFPTLDYASPNQVVATLSAGDAALFGGGVHGTVGWVWTPKATDARLDDFTVHPFVYRAQMTPDAGRQVWEITPNGAIPGDAPALARTSLQLTDAVAGSPDWGMFALIPRPVRTNLAVNPAFANSVLGTPTPWSVAGAAGVTGAATSITSDAATSGRARQTGSLVCPATANTGVVCLVRAPGGFQKGRTYTVWARVKSASATPGRVRLGVSGDIASSAAVPLTSGWVEWTTQWTPATTVQHAYIAVEITAAVATTLSIDSVVVVDGTTQPDISAQVQGGSGGTPPVGIISPLAITDFSGCSLGAHAVAWPWIFGTTLRATSGTSAYARWMIDPEALDKDDHQDTVDVEVWAAIVTPATFTNGRVILTCGPSATREYGAAGLALPASSTGLWRLGTVTLPRDRGTATRLKLAFTWNAISGNLDVPFLLAVPPGARAITGPTGKASSPIFPADISGIAGCALRTDPDGRCFVKNWGTDWWPSPSLDATVEVPPGEFSMLGVLVANYPDGGNVSADIATTMRRVSPFPRSHFMRPA